METDAGVGIAFYLQKSDLHLGEFGPRMLGVPNTCEHFTCGLHSSKDWDRGRGGWERSPAEQEPGDRCLLPPQTQQGFKPPER